MPKAQELKDLDVDRVDGVDKPATGRNFLLFKSEDGDAIMKGYGAVATAAHIVLEKVRKDSKAVVSRKSAVALNGLAQVLGEDAVFVGKSVPTQPYSFTEPDADKRGPADEKLGANFAARAMPGSMVGSVQFSVADADGIAKAWPPAKDEPDEDDKDEPFGGKKAKPFAAKAKGDGDEPDEDDMDASEKANRGIARSMAAMAKAMEALPGQIVKALVAGPVQKDEGDEPEPARRPRSRQIEGDEPVQVRKAAGGYEPRLGVSFANVAFGKDGLSRM